MKVVTTGLVGSKYAKNYSKGKPMPAAAFFVVLFALLLALKQKIFLLAMRPPSSFI